MCPRRETIPGQAEAPLTRQSYRTSHPRHVVDKLFSQLDWRRNKRTTSVESNNQDLDLDPSRSIVQEYQSCLVLLYSVVTLRL